jgi:hypothetical protein
MDWFEPQLVKETISISEYLSFHFASINQVKSISIHAGKSWQIYVYMRSSQEKGTGFLVGFKGKEVLQS